MPILPSRKRNRRALQVLVLGCLAAAVTHASAQTAFVWKGGTGSWSDPTMWNTGKVPNDATADVYIDGNKTTIDSDVSTNGRYTLGRLTINLGDTLEVTNNDIETFVNGSFTGSGTINNDGTLNVESTGSGDYLEYTGATTLTGTGVTNLDGPGNIIFATNTGDRLTIGADATLAGTCNVGNGRSTFTNNGTVSANQNGNTLTLAPGGGSADFTNGSTGFAEAVNGGILELASGTFNHGTFRAQTGSQVKIDSSTTVAGATLATSGTGTVTMDRPTLTDVTSTGALSANDNAIVILTGTFTNDGTFNLESTGSGDYLEYTGATTLTGTGVTNLDGPGDAVFGSNTGDRLTIGVNATLAGTGNVGNGRSTVTNNGTVSANQNGNTLTLQPGGSNDFTNGSTGVAEAANGGILELVSGTFNHGTFRAQTGSQVKIDGGTTVAGATLATSGTGTITMDGTTLTDVTSTGALSANDNAIVTLTGTLTNDGTFNFESTGSGDFLEYTGATTLAGTGVTNLDGPKDAVFATNAGDRLTIGAGATLAGTGNVGNGGSTFTNNGTVSANQNGDTLTLQLGGSNDFTNGSTGVAEAVNGGILALTTGTFTNNGTIAALAGSTVSLPSGTLSNLANNTLTGGTYKVVASSSAAATLDFGGATFTTNAATIILNGTKAAFAAVMPLNDNQGSFTLLNQRDFITAGDLSNEGKLSIGAGSTLHDAGNYVAGSNSTLAVAIGGTATQGTGSPGILQVTGAATVAGSLAVSLTSSAPLPAGSATLTILSAASAISGHFANVSSGQRLNTTDGRGSFEVDYGSGSPQAATAMVLSHFKISLPVITSAMTASATEGQAFSYQIAARNSPTSFGVQGLPAGLAVNASTGFISGTPTVSGTYTLTLNAYNATGKGSATLTLTIKAVAPVITSARTAAATEGVAFSYQITAAYQPASFGVQGLPAGLTVDTRTGIISGTPTVPGTYTLTLNAYNTIGKGSATLTLTVAGAPPAITSATAASATQGTPFSYQIKATNSPTSFGVQGLPGGLAVNVSTGLISGTPKAVGTYTLTLHAYNATGKGSATLTLTIKGAAPVITSAKTASGTTGKTFSYQIAATNSPTSYGVQGLPGGLAVNVSTGLISGTPKVAGTFTLTLNAYNATGKGTATLTLTVALGPPIVTSATAASGKVGVAFSYQIVASSSPTSYGVQGLPAGLSVNATTGLISGTPKAAGTYTLTLNCYNNAGKGSATLTLAVSN